MTIQVLYSILSNIDISIVKNGKNIFNGTADNIPIVLMNEWVEYITTNHDDLIIVLK